MPQVNYKLRDWLFARQRYWGEPFPIMFEEGSDVPVLVPESELPLVLPDTDSFKPTGDGSPPLAAITEWVNVTRYRERERVDRVGSHGWWKRPCLQTAPDERKAYWGLAGRTQPKR